MHNKKKLYELVPLQFSEPRGHSNSPRDKNHNKSGFLHYEKIQDKVFISELQMSRFPPVSERLLQRTKLEIKRFISVQFLRNVFF